MKAYLAFTLLMLMGYSEVHANTQARAKHPVEAVAWSVLGTAVGPAMVGLAYGIMAEGEGPAVIAVPLALTGVGLAVVGPSLGHWYAGQEDLGMIGARTGAVAGLLVGGLLKTGDGKTELAGDMLITASLATIGVTTLYDLYTAPRAVRRYNQQWLLAPMATMNASGHATGVQLVGRF